VITINISQLIVLSNIYMPKIKTGIKKTVDKILRISGFLILELKLKAIL